uniref:Metalloendopeptidase n=1 Tax=Panagrolaimus sp. JU765 TaxID=591449 RepID=A0AC34RHA3_9BILA
MWFILVLLPCFFIFTVGIDPELLKFNQKVYAEYLVDNSDALTDDDIRSSKVEYTDGSDEESFQWPNGEIPYSLDIPKFNEEFLKEFYSALDEFHLKTCVKFRPKQKTDQYFVKIIRGDGCWSYVGMQPDLIQQGQELSLGDECWRRGIIVHELNHVIGFFHEHSRFDRDAYIYLNFTNIQKNRIRQFDQRPRQKVDEIGVYDLYSIMHYEQNAFAVDKRAPTIIPKMKHAKINEMGQRKYLSPTDVAKILVLYNCSSKLTKPSPEVLKSHKNVEMPFHDEHEQFHSFPSKMSALKTKSVQKFVPFKSFDDFKTRTGLKEIPEGYSFQFLMTDKKEAGTVRDDLRFKMYPSPDVEIGVKMEEAEKIRCGYFAASNCADQLKECPKLATDDRAVIATVPNVLTQMTNKNSTLYVPQKITILLQMLV